MPKHTPNRAVVRLAVACVRRRLSVMAQTLRGSKDQAALGSHMLTQAAGLVSLQLSAIGAGFLISLLLARSLGSSGYGVYTYALTWVNLLSVLVVFGYDRLLVRQMAVYQVQSAWGLMRGLLGWVDRFVLLACAGLVFCIVVVAIVILAWAGAAGFDPQVMVPLWIALLGLPLLAFLRVRQAALQGLRQVVKSQLPEMFLQPVLFLALFGGSWLLFKSSVSPALAVGLHVITLSLACLTSVKLLHTALPPAVQRMREGVGMLPAYQARAWLRSVLPLAAISGLHVLNMHADILLLGSLYSVDAVGTYAVAARGAGLVAFSLSAFNSVLAPMIARLYAEGDLARLQQLVTTGARVSVCLSLPLAAGFIIGGSWFLDFFGPNFSHGQAILAVLSVSQLVNVGMGSVGQLLVMTGHEGDVVKGVGVSTVLNIFLNIVLIPYWGGQGTAVARATSTVMWNMILAIWVYKRLGIHPTILGRISSLERWT